MSLWRQSSCGGVGAGAAQCRTGAARAVWQERALSVQAVMLWRERRGERAERRVTVPPRAKQLELLYTLYSCTPCTAVQVVGCTTCTAASDEQYDERL